MLGSVVISVPHSACPPPPINNDNNTHPCDVEALPFAWRLLRSLHPRLRKTIVMAETPRATVDLNRASGRHHRGGLREEALKDKKSRTVVVDVHSFDDDAPWGDNHEMVLFDVAPVSTSTIVVAGHLRTSNVRSAVLMDVVGMYDILREIKTEMSVPCLMVEVREGLSEARYAELGAALAAAIEFAFGCDL